MNQDNGMWKWECDNCGRTFGDRDIRQLEKRVLAHSCDTSIMVDSVLGQSGRMSTLLEDEVKVKTEA